MLSVFFCFFQVNQEPIQGWATLADSAKKFCNRSRTHPMGFSLTNQFSPHRPLSILELASNNGADNLFRSA